MNQDNAVFSQIQTRINEFMGGATNVLGKPSLPLEVVLDGIVDNLTNFLNSAAAQPAADFYDNLRERFPHLREQALQTPFGQITTPEVGLPDLRKLTITPRKRDALKAAIAIDLSTAVGLIPIVGDVAADIAEDTYGARLRELLTAREFELYQKFDKLGPSTTALLRAFMTESIEV